MAHRIYIVEDHPILRRVTRDVLEYDPNLTVCGVAATGEAALEALARLEAELILVDVSLPEMSGIEMVKKLLERRPDLRCLMYSGHGETGYVEQALAAGARGYVLKGDPEELLQAIHHVVGGETYLGKSLEERGSC